jgi:hypothetical protein
MAKTITIVEESTIQELNYAIDPKPKVVQKIKTKKRKRRFLEKILIKDVLGDFSTQTGSYF